MFHYELKLHCPYLYSVRTKELIRKIMGMRFYRVCKTNIVSYNVEVLVRMHRAGTAVRGAVSNDSVREISQRVAAPRFSQRASPTCSQH